MMNYIIWDKKSPINEVEAEVFIKDLKIREKDGVFLIGSDLDNIQAVEIDRIIKNVYELDQNLTTEEVAQEYVRRKEEEKAQAALAQQEEQSNAERLANVEEGVANIEYGLMMSGLI